MAAGPGSEPVRTVGSYCGVGCGLAVETDGRQVRKVSGDKAHPANGGRLCTKGATHADMMARSSRSPAAKRWPWCASGSPAATRSLKR
ncbi:molybdopterin-dependent oxidoreductase iron-sulfur protein [Nocardia puris]|uniref:Molybdopterin-dependent oxidoreductase iron-sulfur protein n=1 Tax=Nocardia puris TaxID=208602 RepID=A0A366DW30_9NOCA|nr:molybdopterin-dependent oxidoreductase iron-sulfur protein [Nocardia puris]